MSSSNLCPPIQPTNQTTINTPSSNYFELESQFILRMPLVKGDNGIKKVHPAAGALREALVAKLCKTTTESALDVEAAVDDIKERLFIELNTETRKGRLKFDDETFEARLVDLPCIVESLKTTDKKMFYKTADICQMLVCKTQDDPWNSSDEEAIKNANANDNKKKPLKKGEEKNNALNKYKWPHGLAPPLKNVRRKRFRKMAKKKIIDYAEIEKEVKQLFRADRDAFKIDYEVLLVEGALEDEENPDNKNIDGNNSLNNEDEEWVDEIGGLLSDGNSCMDSVMDTADASKLSRPASGLDRLQREGKIVNAADESNMSFGVDDDSMMGAPTPVGKGAKVGDTDAEDGETMNLGGGQFDEGSMDNSNLPEQSSKSSKHRTGFKDLFVKDVLGDLSSSEEDDSESNDDESKTDQNNPPKIVKSFKFNMDKNSIHMNSNNASTFTIGEESNMSTNFEDSNIGFGQNELSESDTSNLDSSKFQARTSNKNNQNIQVATTKNLDILDANSHAGDDTDLDISLGATNLKKDKVVEDYNFSDLSSSDDDEGNKAELSEKLNGLMDELVKIQADRKKLETEIKNINNQVLKAHLSSRLKNLIDEEDRKQGEIDEVRTELNE